MLPRTLATASLVTALAVSGVCADKIDDSAPAARPAQRQWCKDGGGLVDRMAKPLPPSSFNGIDESLTLGQIVDRLGPASEVTGSGLCIFVWRVTDGREFWVGTENCKPSRPPIYAKFR